jgi:predicted Co/Zn/Cd cation transporter (cation efflux family)
MNRRQALLISALTVIVIITLVAVLWGPESQAISIIYFDGATSDTDASLMVFKESRKTI